MLKIFLSRSRRLGLKFAAAVLGTTPVLGFIETCSDFGVNATRYVDPCGTVFANCAPNSFYANSLDLGSEEARCWDPTCTIPGACGPYIPVCDR